MRPEYNIRLLIVNLHRPRTHRGGAMGGTLGEWPAVNQQTGVGGDPAHGLPIWSPLQWQLR